MLLRI